MQLWIAGRGAASGDFEYGQEYQFVYDMEEDREKLLKWLSRDLFRDAHTIYGGSLGFMDETYNPDKTFKEELIKGLQDAPHRDDIVSGQGHRYSALFGLCLCRNAAL